MGCASALQAIQPPLAPETGARGAFVDRRGVYQLPGFKSLIAWPLRPIPRDRARARRSANCFGVNYFRLILPAVSRFWPRSLRCGILR